MRRFFLFRDKDPTGMSGIGRVADGVEFSNGKVAMTWKKEFPSVTVYDSISVVQRLHTHNGKDPTKIVWVDSMDDDLTERSEELLQKEKSRERSGE